MKEKVEKALEEIRVFLKADGGDIELVGVEGKTVKVRLTGACSGCPFATFTLRQRVEQRLKELVPEVEKVEEVC
jgi:Fe-S cluster biogenesis protein NfuA